jgi:protein involved in polysaccharide export with SLBB domain
MKRRGYLSETDLQYLASRVSEDRASAIPDSDAAPSWRRIRPSPRTSVRPNPETRTPEDQNQPLTKPKPSPYPSLPSLRDLYRQIPGQRAALRRFGMDVFRNGTGNLEKLPMDLPAGPDYVLGTGDGISINLSGSVSRTITKTIDREGRIALPEAGTVVLAGRTVVQAQELIQKLLGTQLRNVKADVSLTRLRTVRIYVVGDVERPGTYDISALSTPLNALYLAGGPTNRGSLRSVRVYRRERLVGEVDLYELLLEGVRSGMEHLEAGDTVLVPPVGPQVTVAGMVRRPAIYELGKEKELAEVLQIAGGVLVSANLRQISVERIEAHERRVMLKVDLPAASDNETVNTAQSGFRVQDGDYVTISPILPYSDQTVYLDGHVFRPGKYPYHTGMQMAELIRSYQDLLPEPSDRAEIIRLVAA